MIIATALLLLACVTFTVCTAALIYFNIKGQ